MSLKDALGNLLTALLVGCALILTIIAVRREFAGAQSVSEPPPIENWEELLEGAPSIGASTAPTRLIEFMDYQCPYCAEMQPLIDSLLEEYPDSLQVVVRHMPLANHPQALPAAVFAECAGKQGHFHEAHRILLAEQPLVAAADWESLTEYVGLDDPGRFKACLEDSTVSRKVLDDAAAAVILGVRYTPTFLVVDRWATGRQDRGELQRLLWP